MEHEGRGVHFEVDGGHQNNIVVKQGNKSNDSSLHQIDIHVGFLQVLHKYEVVVPIPKSFLPNSREIVPIENQMPNLLFRLLKIEKCSLDEEIVNITLEVTPPKEKLYKERISLEVIENGDKSKRIDLKLHCRVLGKGKGTPMLRNGIRLIERLPDPDESDVNSDWQGFG